MKFRSIVIVAISLLFLITTSSEGAIREDNLLTLSGFEESTTNSPPPGIDLDVTYISREPRYKWDSPKKWPDQGETATFIAHIINKGTIDSGQYSFEWRIDDQIVTTGSDSSIPPQGEATQQIEWEWKAGRHYVVFEIDPQNLILETAEKNNKIEDFTDALTIGFWVEETVYSDFNNLENGAGTYSWEDWAQRIIQKMNWMFEQSAYPLAPNGIVTRVRLDNITIAPDGTLFNQTDHAPYDTSYDGRWGFPIEVYGNGCQCCPTDICYDVPWWVIHELGHYLFGRVDIYGLDIQGGDVEVLDEEGIPIAGTPLLPYIAYDVVHYASRIYDVMHSHIYSIFSDYHAYSLNIDWPPGQRTHPGWWGYIYNIPSETIVRVLDNNDQPIPNVEVSVYQAVDGDGTSGPYSQNFDNTPDIVGVSDSQGLFSLGSSPFGAFEKYWGATAGIILVKLKNLDTGIYRYISIEVTDLNLAYWRGNTDSYIHDIHFPSGSKKLEISETSLEFTVYQGSNPSPKSIDVNVLGEGVQYWSIEEPYVSWLRSLPSTLTHANHTEYPPGPLTLIVESSELPIGFYSTEISVSAGDIIDSPQIVTVNLNVIEAPPSSSISGHIRDQSGNPIDNVVISDEFGHSVTTDALGNYTFSDLPAGSYTITPSSTIYNFLPAAQLVTVPPNAADVNFVTKENRPNYFYLPLVNKYIPQNSITLTIFGQENDGEVLNNPCSDWDTCRNATNGTNMWQGLAAGTVGSILTDSGYMISRPFLFFDTSVIPTNANIFSATLNVYAGQWQNGNRTIHVVPSMADIPLSISDFSKIQFVSGGSITPSSPNIWMQINLDSAALDWIIPGYVTKIALIHEFDLNNIMPNAPNDVLVALAEDIQHRPYLVVTYVLPSIE